MRQESIRGQLIARICNTHRLPVSPSEGIIGRQNRINQDEVFFALANIRSAACYRRKPTSALAASGWGKTCLFGIESKYPRSKLRGIDV
jgi:hypothetical protein